MFSAYFGSERTMLTTLAVACLLTACQDPERATGPSMSRVMPPTDTTLTASRDGYVTSEHPNRNGGAKDSMDVARPLRSLVAFDQAAIANAVGAGTLAHATLRLTVGRAAENWGPNGRTIDVHRVTVPWTEAGETYNCAIDASPGNATKECAGVTEWAMASTTTPPWASPRTAQALVTNGMTGTVEFDVTADVAAFLGGTPNEGWLLKKSDETKQGRVVFLTKEGGASPELVLTVTGTVPDTARPAIPAYGWPADSGYVFAPTVDSIVYYRRLMSISFEPGAAGILVNQFLEKYNATIVGGRPNAGAYIIQIPDPGTSLDSLTAVAARMRAEPGVEFVILISFRSGRPIVNSRFPADGPGFDRPSWSAAASPALWALKAIRAPLAWGCETGTEGTSPVSIGVVEWGFQAAQPGNDFDSPSPAVFSAGATLSEAIPPSRMDSLRWHGTAVTGVIGATGDNGRGVAGMVWRSTLYRYALGHPTGIPQAEYIAFRDEVLEQLDVDHPRIVNISVELKKDRANPDVPAELAKRLQQLLTNHPSMLIVVAGGNEGPVITPDSLSALPGGGLLILDALVRAKRSGFDGQVIVVGGSEPTGSGIQVRPNYQFVDGAVDIVAPALNVRVLGGPPHTSEVLERPGTSFAAPMVAGVAAQLLATQPNLMPAQVKHYILAGAQEPRLDPETGATIGLAELRLSRAGASQSVFQLDAYGALTLLSRNDPSTPICGYPVVTSFVENPTTGELETSVRIARPGAILEVYRGEVGSVTVAQGGRRIGIDGYTSSRDVLFQDGSWNGTHAVAFRGFRQFLERDTAFVDFSTGPELLTIRGAGGSRGPFSVCDGFTNTFGTACHSGPIASTGEWAFATVSRSNYDVTGCGPANGYYGSYLVPLGTGSSVPLRETSFEPCPPAAGAWSVPDASVLAWRSDGAVAWVGHSDVDYLVTPGYDDPLDPNPPPNVNTTTGLQTRFEQVSVVPGVPALGGRTIPGRLAYALGWRADGSALISYEYAGMDWANCQRVVRGGLAPEIELADSAGPVPWCGNTVMEPLPALRLSAPLASALRRTGPSGAPVSPLRSRAERRLQTLQQRQVPRIVLVN